ncbi:hypothetical protein [Paenibacillus taichungensis]|uniref:hypothetical protein n=1 Tax=Paenibacillus taichungensis TaxID=484184 RepID=UPI0028727ED3|nr:hypothetical protein [Paenibacillus taichungensis]MDR9749292.1 hypothetical protein [Paenibacillus taichungensis]
MPLLHYAKVNINSNIFDVYKQESSIEDIMERLFELINDKTEYEKSSYRSFMNGEERSEFRYSETYNFSELNKVKKGNQFYIIGKLVRRYPIFTEEFDALTRTSRPAVISNNSTSILFYFDLESEIVVFSERQKFGYNQFTESMKELLNLSHAQIGYEVFLLNDPYTMKERLERAHKVKRIKSVVIPPNVNEEALGDLYDKDVKEMEEANITKKTNLFEVNDKSNKGINVNSKLVSAVINTNEAYEKYAKGYGRLEVEGEYADGSTFKFDSEEDSPYQTHIEEREKNDWQRFKALAQKGISIFRAKVTINKHTDG